MSSGSFGCFAHKAGDIFAREFDGTPGGLNEALAYAATIVPPLLVANGVVSCFPSKGGISIPTVPVGVVLIVTEGARVRVFTAGGEVKAGGSTNVLLYPTFQAAVDATPTNGSLFIPTPPNGVQYDQNSYPAWTGAVVARAMRIYGEHRQVQLRWFAAGANNAHHFNVTAPAGVTIEKLTIAGPSVAGFGDLIRWYASQANMWDLTLRDLTLLDPPAWGIKVMCDSTFFFQKLHTFDIQHGAYSAGPAGGGIDTSCPTHAAYYNQPTGSGDLWLGGGANTGGNNCRIIDHEMQGPSAGSWDTGRTLPALTCNLSGTSITLITGTFYDKRVYKNAAVTGTGIPANTKVVSINAAGTIVTVNNSMTTGSSIACTFKELQQYGNLHIDQCNVVRFDRVSFQGKDHSPSWSARYFCDGLVWNGLYMETLLGTPPENDFRIVIDGACRGLNLNIHYYKSTRGIAAGAPANRGMRLIKATAGAAIYGAKLHDCLIYRWDSPTTQSGFVPTDDIDFALDSHQMIIDNVVSLATDGNIYDAIAGLVFGRNGVATVQPGITFAHGPYAGDRFSLIAVNKATLANIQDGQIVRDTSDGKYYARRSGAWEVLQ